MNCTAEQLQSFGAVIQRLINRDDLSAEETCAAFAQILDQQQPDLHQGALLAALVSKGETAAEVAGAWRAIMTHDTVTVASPLPEPLVENSGTGMDRLKTFNVSSAAAIVAAACGVHLARHGARALTSAVGTVDLLEAVGVDVECEVARVAASISTTGIGLFNGMSPKVHPGGLSRILRQIRFGSTLNIAASLANPARPGYAVRGVYSESLLSLAATVMAQIGYRRGMVVHGYADAGEGGMDELSPAGKTAILEFDTVAGTQNRYTIQPEDLGLRRQTFAGIAATGNLAAERRRLLRVLAGHEEAGCLDFTCLNAAAVLVVSGHACDLVAGIAQAREAISSGAAMATLTAWVHVQNRDPDAGIAKLNEGCLAAAVEPP